MSKDAKEIIYNEQARKKLLSGIEQMSKAVRATLGPLGRNIGVETSWGAPTITNDGHSIVKEIELKDQFENMGASLAKEVASKMKEQCGDGTTTATLLLYALVAGGVKNIAAGASPIGIKRGIDKAVEQVVKTIEKSASKVEKDEEIKRIATVSASGHEDIGELISQAFKKVGASGVISIEEAKGTDTSIEMVEGMQFDRGYLSPYFCNNQEKMALEMKDAHLFIVDRKINSIHEILPILQWAATANKELLIIADDIEGDALATLVVNRLRGSLKAAAVKAPGFGDRKKAILQDIATLTGATVVSEEIGMNLKDVNADVLGQAEKIVINKESTTIIGGKGETHHIEARVKQIEAEMANTTSTYDKEKLEERKAKLIGGVAVIRVGASTEPEMKQKKQMFEDSLNSTKAALLEGVVAGGGTALLRAGIALDDLSLEGDEAIGARLVKQACQAPLRQIVENAGLDSSVVLGEVLATSNAHVGFNAQTRTVENLQKVGVFDPAKVVKSALINAASLAGIVLLSEALIGDDEEEEK